MSRSCSKSELIQSEPRAASGTSGEEIQVKIELARPKGSEGDLIEK